MWPHEASETAPDLVLGFRPQMTTCSEPLTAAGPPEQSREARESWAPVHGAAHQRQPLPEEQRGQQRDGQRLGVDDDAAQPRRRPLQPLCQEALRLGVWLISFLDVFDKGDRPTWLLL